MKILEPGNLPNKDKNDPPMTGACWYCGCKVAVNRSEAKQLPYGWGQIEYLVDCPTPGCGERIVVKEAK